jgi:hypothetical protein
MMQDQTSDMKTHLLDSVAKLNQIIQTLEERQSKLTISKSTMMGLLPELPIMALSDFEKFEGYLGTMEYECKKL